MLSVKQRGIKYFGITQLTYWTPVTQTIGELFNHYTNGLVLRIIAGNFNCLHQIIISSVVEGDPKAPLTDKIKRSFFQASDVYTVVCIHYMDAN